MGTISEKLTYLNGTKGKLKDSINKFRDGITNQTAFRNYATELDGIYDKLPKVDNTSDASQLLNAQNGKLDEFKLKGNTQQNSYTGNQLINFSAGTTTLDTTKTFANDILTVSSSNRVYTSAQFNMTTLYKNSGGKTLHMNYDDIDITNFGGGTIAQVVVNYNDNTPTSYKPLITSSGTKVSIGIPNDTSNISGAVLNVYSNNTNQSSGDFSLSITKPLIYFDNNDIYEPYVGGTPSPNPDYPQNINVVSGNQTINVSGKNLFDKSTITIGKRIDPVGVPYTDENYSLSDYILVKSNTIYTSNLTASVYQCIAFYTSDKTFISRNISDTTVTTPSNAYYARFSMENANVDTAQLEEGSTATTYEPYYAPQNYTIGLGSMELCKIGDYQDYIYKDDNKWYKKGYIGKVVLDGSEDGWFTQKNSSPYIYALNYDNYKRTQENICKSNLFISVVNSGYGDLINNNINFRYSSGDTNKYLYICTTVASSINDFKTWLSTHNLIVYYVLATPTDTQITDTTLINQLEAIKVFTGSNYFTLSNSNNVLPTLYVSRLKELKKLS